LAAHEAASESPIQRTRGLEYERVYLVGAEEGLLPHQKSVDEGTVEEERRLMYVAITRARRHLTITWCRERARHGKRLACRKSRFLFEMTGETPPPDYFRAPAGPPPGRDPGRGGRRRRR
jgi:superfamily I DNA/RNA helicase